MLRSRRHCCHRTQQCILCVTVTVNNIKIIIVAQWLYGNTSAGNRNILLGLNVKSQCFCPILTKSGLHRQIFIESPISIFTEIRPVGAALIYSYVERRTDVKKVISALHGYANASKKRSLWPDSVLGSVRTETALTSLRTGMFIRPVCCLAKGEPYVGSATSCRTSIAQVGLMNKSQWQRETRRREEIE